MKTTKLLSMATFLCGILGFVSTGVAQRQQSSAGTTGGASAQEMASIQQLAGFLRQVDSLQTQGFIDAATANSLESPTWSIIGNAALLSLAVDCHSVADLINEVNTTSLPPKKKGQLVTTLNGVQADIAAAQASQQQGNSSQALEQELAAIQGLGTFVANVESFRVHGFLDAATADALETCALNLVATVRSNISNGLVAYYSFNGDANDASGNGNNGTVVGATFQTYGTSGKMALQFAGNTSSYVVVPRSASLEPPDGLSISMWCNGVPGEACGFGWGTILRKADGCQAGYFIRGCNTSTSFQIDGSNPCFGGPSANAQFLTFTGTTWQHIVGTYSVADGMIKTYENGVLVNQTPLSNSLVHSGDLYIGGAAVAGDDGGFNGLINEVRVYNRSLTASEVQQLYSSSPHP
jgi:Concanavalin A-like lectin/glucanases superfamily